MMLAAGTLQFDSDALPPEERFARYRDLYAGGADAVATGPHLRAKLTAWQLDRVTIFERQLSDVAHVRSAERATADGFDHFVVTLVLSGMVEVDFGHGLRVVPPGSGLIADTRLGGRNQMRDAHLFTLRLTRDRLQERSGVVRDLHGMILPADRTALLIDYVTAVTRRLDQLDKVAVTAATEALCALVIGAIGAPTGAVDAPAEVRDGIRIGRVRALIDAELAQPGFGPDQIIERTGLSRATLYRAFQAHGGLAGYIRTRRLELLRLALGEESEARSFAELALAGGFRSEAHASRLFQQRFGCRPGEYRARVAATRNPHVPMNAMRSWDDRMK